MQQTTGVIESFYDIQITEGQYQSIRDFLYSETGISLGDRKQKLVTGRLSKRLRHHNIHSYGDYFNLISDPSHYGERQQMLDLLTTNETYFFREQVHFDYLTEKILPAHSRGKKFRIWSAASSSGEEAYSLAMELAENLGHDPWEIMGSDICSTVVAAANRALYTMDRIEGIPDQYLKKYCFKGKDEYAGHLLVDPNLAKRVNFEIINLTQPLKSMDKFDVVFLRNVIIYFDLETKIKVINNVASALKPKGYLMIGHSESITNLKLKDSFTHIAPTIYQKV